MPMLLLTDRSKRGKYCNIPKPSDFFSSTKPPCQSEGTQCMPKTYRQRVQSKPAPHNEGEYLETHTT